MENKLKIKYLTKEYKLKYIKIKDFKQYLKIIFLLILVLCFYFFLFSFCNSNKLASSRFMNVQKNNNNHRKKKLISLILKLFYHKYIIQIKSHIL